MLVGALILIGVIALGLVIIINIQDKIDRIIERDESSPWPPGTLYFKNPYFGDGPLYSTIRLGTKWKAASIGDRIQMRATGSEQHLGYARIEAVYVSRLGEVPYDIITIDHHPEYLVHEVLHEMRRIYGPKVELSDIVTVLVFTLSERE